MEELQLKTSLCVLLSGRANIVKRLSSRPIPFNHTLEAKVYGSKITEFKNYINLKRHLLEAL